MSFNHSIGKALFQPPSGAVLSYSVTTATFCLALSAPALPAPRLSVSDCPEAPLLLSYSCSVDLLTIDSVGAERLRLHSNSTAAPVLLSNCILSEVLAPDR
jgi:hypothetical protein